MGSHPQILDVVENDLCIACGACIPACPANAVVPSYSEERGAHEVDVPVRDQCVDCPAPCDDVCPSVAVNYAELHGLPDVPREGAIERTCLAWVKKHRDNGISSSGGIVRAFVESFLMSERPVVCLARSEDGKYEPALLQHIGEMNRLPGSIYHGVSFVQAIPLLQSVTEPCLLVSTPCQLEGIEKYIRHVDSNLADKIALKLGLICGWMYTDHALQAFTSYKGIGNQILDAQYRGEDQVGLLKIRTERGDHSYNRRTFETPSDELDYRASFTSAMNRARCRLCQNHVNVLADIAVGDAWLARSKGVKRSIVVVRSEAGERAFQQLREVMDVEVEESQGTDLVESQSLNLVEGIEARQLAGWLKGKGSFAPSFSYNRGVADEDTQPRAEGIRKFTEEWASRKLIHSGAYREHRNRYALNRRRRMIRSKIRGFVAGIVKGLGLYRSRQS